MNILGDDELTVRNKPLVNCQISLCVLFLEIPFKTNTTDLILTFSVSKFKSLHATNFPAILYRKIHNSLEDILAKVLGGINCTFLKLSP